ncbi:MAG: tetratricopeptide repeat protein [Proteobacteria bacterium]|nr:tetratricopeptide repeat protein [Pseudomonadota bacterium]
MRPRHALVRLTAAALLTLAGLPVFPAPPEARREALSGLSHPDVTHRAEAIVWVAKNGSMADADLLHARLRDDSPVVRDFAEQGLWLLWSRSGDPDIDRMMVRGTEAMQSGQHAEAIAIFTGVIRRRPDFAEGWNKRATVLYLAGEYRRSVADCEEVFKRNPRHFGALSGNGQNWLKLDEVDRALGFLRRALEVNPNMLGVALQIKALEAALRERRGRTA